MSIGKETKCPICKKKFIEHSELQDQYIKWSVLILSNFLMNIILKYIKRIFNLH
jgi:hypothetical protein